MSEDPLVGGLKQALISLRGSELGSSGNIGVPRYILLVQLKAGTVQARYMLELSRSPGCSGGLVGFDHREGTHMSLDIHSKFTVSIL